MKILIAVPTYENIYPDTFKAIYDVDHSGHDVDFEFVRGYDVANARNQIGQITIDNGYDYVLMVDNDVVIPKNTLSFLIDDLESENRVKGMAVGYCLRRTKNAENSENKTTVFKLGAKGYSLDDAYTAEELTDLCGKEQYKIRIRGSGLPCALVHKSIFKRVSYPWFKWQIYDNKTRLSEDLFFCSKIRDLAVPMYVDTRVKCGHMMRHIAYI